MGMFAGVMIGGFTAANFCVDTGIKLLEQQKVVIDLDKETILNNLWALKTKSGS